MTYLTWAEYLALKGDADFDAQAALAKAHRDIDAMTYNRIRRRGFNALTELQQALVKEAVAEQTQFIGSNAELLNNPLASYSINGVSMSWDSGRVRRVGGVYASDAAYSALMQTGLMYREVAP